MTKRFTAGTPAFATSGWKDGWFVVPYEVMFRDVDFFGHVNNAVYFTYFELARTRYWLTLVDGQTPIDIGFIVARAECDFRQQLAIGEKIELAVKVGETRTTSLDFISEIRKENGDVAATGKVVAVLYDWSVRTKIAITDDLRAKIAAFQAS